MHAMNAIIIASRKSLFSVVEFVFYIFILCCYFNADVPKVDFIHTNGGNEML
jgi:hypothetical protein